jgi:hypothetical protein
MIQVIVPDSINQLHSYSSIFLSRHIFSFSPIHYRLLHLDLTGGIYGGINIGAMCEQIKLLGAIVAIHSMLLQP